MSISARERFLDICHFKRQGDLYTFDYFWPETLEKWVRQGAPKQIVPTVDEKVFGGRFLNNYFQFDHWRLLFEVISGVFSTAVYQPSVPGYQINVYQMIPVVPSYKPRVISEDEHTVTLITGSSQTLKVLKDDPFRMPMYLDWPVKDRASWNEYKKRLDPNTPERYPADWNAYVQKMSKLGEETPIALEVGGFYGY
ncbi:hypothetical protein ACFLU0_01230, partial [Chloroflexota bacterium]